MNRYEIEHIAAPYLEKIEYALLDEKSRRGLDEAMRLMVKFAREVVRHPRAYFLVDGLVDYGEEVRITFDELQDKRNQEIEGE